jgi:hypothetical protein
MTKETTKETKKLDIDKFNQDLVKHQQDLISLEKELKCKLSLETLKLQPINNSNEYGIWVKLKVLNPSLYSYLYTHAVKDSWLLSILTFKSEHKCYMGTLVLDYVERIGETDLTSPKDGTQVYLLYYPETGTWKLVSRKQLVKEVLEEVLEALREEGKI